MADLAAVRTAESQPNEDIIHPWSWTRISRVCQELLQLKVPNNPIIEVPQPQPPIGTGETESLNGCIPPAAATATTARHPHPGDQHPPPQVEVSIPKGPKNPPQSHSDRHEAAQSTLDQSSQQGRAEDDGAAQNGAAAHTLQDTHPPTRGKGKAKAHVMNDAGWSSSNFTAEQCDIDVPAIHTYPVQIAYSKASTEKLGKFESTYIDKSAMIPQAIIDKWEKEIQGQLDKEIQDLIRTKYGGKDNILLTTQLYMVGTKHKGILTVKPTIVITCGTAESKARIAVGLGNRKLHYLDDFGYPWRVRYVKPPSWTASPLNEAPDMLFGTPEPVISTASPLNEAPDMPFGTPGPVISNLQGVYVEQNTGISGLKLRFDILQDGIIEHRYATLGGFISINETNLLMTTAHPFLAELDGGNGPSVSDDLEAPVSDSDSDSDYQGDTEGVEPSNYPRTLLPLEQMRYSRLWVSEQWTRVAYSFLGRIYSSNAGNTTQLQWPSSSDWALFQVTEGSLLSQSQMSPQLSSFIPRDRLTPGKVQIMDRVDAVSAGFLTQTTASIHTAKAVMHVREILLDEVLSNGASGAWVKRGTDVCGYIVAATGSGRSCFMVPMDCAFKEIEAAFGVKPKLGPELVTLSEEDEAWGSLYNTGMEPTSDDHRPADSTRSTYETQRSDNQRPVPATDTRKNSWIHSLTKKAVSMFQKERHPYELLSIFNRRAGSQSTPRFRANNPDPYPIEMRDMDDVISRIDPDHERSMSIIPRSWQEDPRGNGKKATDWSSRKKAWNFYVILLITFLNTLASTVVAPGVPSIMDEFGTNNVLGAFVISIFVLGQITGPLLLVPISNSCGRLLVYHLSNLSFVIWNIACALAPNTSALLMFRLFAGCAAAGPLAIGRSSVEDMFLYIKRDECPRFLIFAANTSLERPLILLSIASMLGPCIGPVFGGFLVEKEGWRWTFWLVASVGGLITIMATFVMSETDEWAISEGRMKKLHHLLLSRHTRRWLARSVSGSFDITELFKSLTSWIVLAPAICIGPLRTLSFSWTILAPVIYLALMKGCMNILYTTLTPVFTAMFRNITKWHFTPSQAGFTFNTIVVGTVTGSLAGLIFLKMERNAVRKRMQREHLSLLPYLPLAFAASSLFASGGLIAFGMAVKMSQPISTLAVTTLAITGTTLGVLTAEASMYRMAKADTTDAINFLGSLAGGLFPLIAQALYLLPSGIVWTNAIFGVAALFILERVWCWYRRGEWITSDMMYPRSPRLEGNTMPDYVELGASRDYSSPVIK